MKLVQEAFDRGLALIESKRDALEKLARRLLKAGTPALPRR